MVLKQIHSRYHKMCFLQSPYLEATSLEWMKSVRFDLHKLSTQENSS